MPNISASSYNAYRTCPRLYYWKHVLQLVLVREEGARRFGTMFHAGLEAWWRASEGGLVPWKDRDESLVVALRALAENAKHIDTDPFDVAKAEALMVAYHARYYEADFERVNVDGTDGVEEWFKLPLRDERGRIINGWFITGKRDAMMRFADKRVRVVEHKTTGQEIHGASDYWRRLAIDTQVSMYVDAAQQLGHDTNEALFDVVRKPELKPLRATPEDKRKMTKGKGCKHCGGRAGGKGGVAAGTGRIMVRTKVDGDGNLLPAAIDVETTCTACNGTGWDEPPRLDAKQRTEDETADSYRTRVREEIEGDPNAYFRQAHVARDADEIAEMRADLVMTTGEIGAIVELARKTGEVRSVEARRCFPRNTQACTNQYGRRCDYLDACSGSVNPFESPHYQIRTRDAR